MKFIPGGIWLLCTFYTLLLFFIIKIKLIVVCLIHKTRKFNSSSIYDFDNNPKTLNLYITLKIKSLTKIHTYEKYPFLIPACLTLRMQYCS